MKRRDFVKLISAASLAPLTGGGGNKTKVRPVYTDTPNLLKPGN